jgi:hypothetical protein
MTIDILISYRDGGVQPMQMMGFYGISVDGRNYTVEELQKILGGGEQSLLQRTERLEKEVFRSAEFPRCACGRDAYFKATDENGKVTYHCATGCRQAEKP